MGGLAVTRDLLGSLHQDGKLRRVTLDNTLDRDLGLDSSARVKLFCRSETAYA